MDFNQWEKWYTEILDDFGFSREGDELSAKVLDELLDNEDKITLEELKNSLISDKAIVFGAGPSLKKHISEVKNDYKDHVFIVADGATSALLEEHIVPDIIITDLDGKLDDLLFANDKGSSMVIHSHGDNIYQITNFTPFFNRIIGTTQSKPHGNVFNFGGFTDGDRALFLAIALGIEEVKLAGMDFGTVVTRYSRPNIEGDLAPADEIKTKKLQYAEKLTKWAQDNTSCNISFLE